MAKRISLIIGPIIEALNKPVTKEEILQILVEKNPGRDKLKMTHTITTYVPYRLKKDKGLNVIKDSDGKFFIQKPEATPQEIPTQDA